MSSLQVCIALLHNTGNSAIGEKSWLKMRNYWYFKDKNIALFLGFIILLSDDVVIIKMYVSEKEMWNEMFANKMLSFDLF